MTFKSRYIMREKLLNLSVGFVLGTVS